MTDAGRRKKFHRLVWPHVRTVARAARLLAANDADGDDLAQDALLKAYRAIESFGGEQKTCAWLMTILRHAHIDRVRATRRRTASLDALSADVPDDRQPTEEIDPAELSGDPDEVLARVSDGEVVRALRALPKEIRWTLLLVDVQGLDHAEAASVLGVPLGTIKSRAHRGRAMLRVSLSRLAPDSPAHTRGAVKEECQAAGGTLDSLCALTVPAAR